MILIIIIIMKDGRKLHRDERMMFNKMDSQLEEPLN